MYYIRVSINYGLFHSYSESQQFPRFPMNSRNLSSSRRLKNVSETSMSDVFETWNFKERKKTDTEICETSLRRL